MQLWTISLTPGPVMPKLESKGCVSYAVTEADYNHLLLKNTPVNFCVKFSTSHNQIRNTSRLCTGSSIQCLVLLSWWVLQQRWVELEEWCTCHCIMHDTFMPKKCGKNRSHAEGCWWWQCLSDRLTSFWRAMRTVWFMNWTFTAWMMAMMYWLARRVTSVSLWMQRATSFLASCFWWPVQT